MFILVKGGDTESDNLILNSHCRCVSLLGELRKKTCLDLQAEIELCDLSGAVKNIRDSPQKYASEVLGTRQTYVLLKVDRPDDFSVRYQPFTSDPDVVTEEFMARLASKHRPSSRRGMRKQLPSSRSGKETPPKLGARDTKEGRESPRKSVAKDKSRLKAKRS